MTMIKKGPRKTLSPPTNAPATLPLEDVILDTLKSHPRNYRAHPDDEIEHLVESIRANGVYRNVVIAQDGTILAGHGVVTAARRLGLETLPVYRTTYGPVNQRTIKLPVIDNEISLLCISNNGALTKLLRHLKEAE